METNNQRIEFIPGTESLDAMRNEPLVWKDCLSELIDNSFDAGATRVVITLDPRTVTVQDDGVGCDDMRAMLRQGHHRATGTTRSGRYGMGLKNAVIWLWGTTDIVTRHKGIQRSTHVDWKRVRSSGEWATEMEQRSTNEIGTIIRCSSICRSMPDYQNLVDEIGFIFSPALRHLGKQIVIRTTKKIYTCSPYELPARDQVIEDEFNVEGKSVRISIGIVKEGHKNEKQGFIYHFAHRVLMVSAMGAGGYSVSRIAGLVHLGREWDIAKNKNGLTDESRDVLAEEIFDRSKDILMRAQQQASMLQLKELSARVEQHIKDMILAVLDKKERRKSRVKQTGTVLAQGTEATRKRAEETQPGTKKLLTKASSGITIDWNTDEKRTEMGQVDLMAKPPRVTLNLANAMIKRLSHTSNEDGIAIAAIWLYNLQAWDTSNPQGWLFARYNSAIEAASMMLGSIGEARNQQLSANEASA